MWGQVAALAKSHMNGSIAFKGRVKQTTETIVLKTITVYTIIN